MTRGSASLALAGLTALLLVAPWGFVAGDNDWRGGYDFERECKPCGAYTGVDPGGVTWSQTIMPCDPACKRMTGFVKFPNISPVGPGAPIFPNTEFRTDLVANMVKTGPNTWDFTWVGYGVEKPPPDQAPFMYAWPLTYIVVMSGTQTFTDDGNHVTYAITMGCWLPEADIDPADGVPDEGVEPFFAIPGYPVPTFVVTGTRLPVVRQ